MTKEEAYRLLDGVSGEIYDQVFYEYDPYEWTEEEYRALTMVIKTLKNLPSAQPEQRWIPVSERLPDDLSEVNVTWVNHNPESYYKFFKDVPFTATAVYYKRKWYWYSSTCADILSEYGRNDFNEVDKDVEIIAWLPLPEPYQSET